MVRGRRLPLVVADFAPALMEGGSTEGEEERDEPAEPGAHAHFADDGGLAPLEECHNGGRDWAGDDAQDVWERPSSCRREHGRDTREDPGAGAEVNTNHSDRGFGGRPWPFAEAFAFMTLRTLQQIVFNHKGYQYYSLLIL